MRFLSVLGVASALLWSNGALAGHVRPGRAAPPVLISGPAFHIHLGSIAHIDIGPGPGWVWVPASYDRYGRFIPAHWARV